MDSIITNTESFIIFPQLQFEIIKIFASAIMIFLAAFLAFKYGLKKDRIINEENENKRLNNIENHLFYSIKLLIDGSRNQAINIDEYRKNFITENDRIMSNMLDKNFHMDNINAIKIEDIFKVFIIRSTNNKNKRSELYNDLNLCFRIINDVLNSFDKEIFELNSEINEYFDMFNGFKKDTINIINSISQDLKEGIVKINEQSFFAEANVNLSNIKNPQNNIFTEKKEMYDLLFECSNKYEINSYSILYAEISREIENYRIFKEDFNNKFLNYVSNLDKVHDKLELIIKQFNDTD
ncbi:MAG TPA: hypothetical protein PKA90_14090 [Ignavibacteria bacterium]|nr:hypothetical protein [Ignavibacteria bacterium]HMR41549.1 hypothetical protein [Ignavibacteria bacterium]